MRLPSPLTAPSVLPLPLRMLTLQPVKNTSVPTCEAHGSETAPNCARLSGVSFFLHAARTTTTPDLFAQSTVAPADAAHARQSPASPTAQRVRFMGGSSGAGASYRRSLGVKAKGGLAYCVGVRLYGALRTSPAGRGQVSASTEDCTGLFSVVLITQRRSHTVMPRARALTLSS